LKKQPPEQRPLFKFLVKKPVRIVAVQALPPVLHQKHANTVVVMARFDINKDFLLLHEHATDAEVMAKRSLIHANPVAGMAVWVGSAN
jgi:hypothetical protein